MPINGEAIFDTRPWTTFGEGPTVMAEKGMNELMTPMTSRDIRFTTKGNVLFALVLGLPTEAVRIKSLATEKIASISLLGSDAQLEWKQVPDALAIQPVTNWPCQHTVVFKITRKQQQTPVNK
jgi:alpha-L-fucosidase